LSGAYLLLNAALYDSEILHTDAYQPCAGHLLIALLLIAQAAYEATGWLDACWAGVHQPSGQSFTKSSCRVAAQRAATA